MKILYIGWVKGGEYQQDMLLHGLKSLFGSDVVDVPKVDYMYRGYDVSSLYGRGYTLFGLLPDLDVDRTDIESKIRQKFFDVVIYGSIHRCRDYFGEVLAAYPADQIIMVDGEDGPQFLTDCVDYGWYFKRELYTPQRRMHSIQFAIPEEKIQEPLEKIYFLAPLDPLNKLTYIYDDEQSYYDSYRSSYFGKTMRKSGWDCLRHIEIMAAGAIPYFQNIEHCPATIMVNLPKRELFVAKAMLEYEHAHLFYSTAGIYIWEDLYHRIRKVLREKLVTTALAKYVLETVNKETHAYVG